MEQVPEVHVSNATVRLLSAVATSGVELANTTLAGAENAIVCWPTSASEAIVRATTVLSPASPSTLRPQQRTEPPVVSTQVWTTPVAKLATLPASPETNVGVSRSLFVSSPSWPKPLSPQQRMKPPVSSAQVWYPPVAIMVTLEERPDTSTGARLMPPGEPLPSWPRPLNPQHFAAPAVVMAQVCKPPAAILVSALATPTTTTGVLTEPLVLFSARVPLPS